MFLVHRLIRTQIDFYFTAEDAEFFMGHRFAQINTDYALFFTAEIAEDAEKDCEYNLF